MTRIKKIPTRVFVCAQDEFLEAVQQLSVQGLLEPKLIVAHKEKVIGEFRYLPQYHNCEWFNPLDLIAGNLPKGTLASTARHVDADTLNQFAWCERSVLKMADRLGGMAVVPYAVRIRHYHRLLAFWLNKVDEHRPDLTVFPGVPHLMYDYVLYAVCKEFGIKTCIFEKTSVPGLIYSVSSIEEILSRRGGRNQAVRPALTSSQRMLATMRQPSGSGQLIHMKYLEQTRGRAISRKTKAARQLVRLALTGPDKGYESVSGYLPENRRRASRWRFLIESLSRSLKRRQIIRHFHRLTTEPDYSVPYVLLALQCEPEKSTAPLSGEYCHQWVFVQALAAVLPDGWRLYVKEHISQFIGLNAIDKTKHAWFYDDVLSSDNVRLLEPRADTKRLIDEAQAVAVTSGTIGFEAVARGTPVIEGGVNWFSGCPGIYRVSSIDDIRKALHEIQRTKVKASEVESFLAHIENLGFQGYVDRHYRGPSGVPREKCVQNVATELKGYIQCG